MLDIQRAPRRKEEIEIINNLQLTIILLKGSLFVVQ